MRLETLDPIDKHGKIRPIADTDFVGRPVVAYIIWLEDGFFVSMDHVMAFRESLGDAMGYIERKRKML